MSLGIAFKGPEGVVLAADSRVTLTTQLAGEKVTIPAHFDNATKLLRVGGQEYVGVVTYGLGAIGQKEPRTAHSFVPEIERLLQMENEGRLSVESFARRLSSFFLDQWAATMPSVDTYVGPDMVFLVGGYDADAPYGRVFEVIVPRRPEPREYLPDSFGPIWGGQGDFTFRLVNGYDPKVPALSKECLGLSDDQVNQLTGHLRSHLGVGIPYQFLPLQDCVDFCLFVIRTTIMLQSFSVGLRGVGGAVDVAVITRTDGFSAIQQKSVCGEERHRLT